MLSVQASSSDQAQPGKGDAAVAVLALPRDDALAEVIGQGLKKGVEDLELLEGAMLAAEQLFLGALSSSSGAQHGLLSSTCASDVDVWQPVFASAGGFPRLLYIPVPEYFDVSRTAADGSIDIVTELGPITTHFLGAASWPSDTRLTYSINTLRVELPLPLAAGKTWSFSLPFRLDNDLTFFLVGDGYAAARSRLGGTMLLAPSPPGAAKYVAARSA